MRIQGDIPERIIFTSYHSTNEQTLKDIQQALTEEADYYRPERKYRTIGGIDPWGERIDLNESYDAFGKRFNSTRVAPDAYPLFEYGELKKNPSHPLAKTQVYLLCQTKKYKDWLEEDDPQWEIQKKRDEEINRQKSDRKAQLAAILEKRKKEQEEKTRRRYDRYL